MKKTPEEVIKFFGCIPTINNGGCGVFALSFHRWLEKNMPEKLANMSIVYLYYSEEFKRFQQNESLSFSAEFNNDEIWTPPHIGILWDNCIVEAGGGEVTAEKYKLWHEVSARFLLENLKKYWTWNGIFSRFLYLPFIEKELEISLEDIRIPNQPPNSKQLWLKFSQEEEAYDS